MKKYVILLLSILPLIISATPQTSEILIYKSDTLSTNDYPLEILMETNLIIKRRITNYAYKTCVMSTCWRGYEGTWEIRNDSLYLINLESACHDINFNLNRTFRQRKIIYNKVFANWYSGEIKAFYCIGKFNDIDKTRYNTKSLIATIERGKIVKILIEPAYDYNFEPLDDRKQNNYEELEHLEDKK